MPTIKVRVSGKIAENLTPEVKIVCRNSDYKVEFEFDEPWQGTNFKTGLFIRNGELIAQPFDGAVCPMPIIENTTLLAIGVKTNDGELYTTTPAYADCLKSASDLATNKIPAPSKDVYDEIIALLNKYISGVGSIDLSDYQKKVDENLPTTNKTIVGAIAEVKEIAETERMVFGETEGTAYEGNKGKANADNIVKLQNEMAIVNVALEQSGLVKKYKQPIMQEYNERVTADGANVLDGSEAVLQKVVGSTVACTNLFDGILVKGFYDNNDFNLKDKTSEVYRSLKIKLPAGQYRISFSVPTTFVRTVIDGVIANVNMSNLFSTNGGEVGYSFRTADNTDWKDEYLVWITEGREEKPYTPYFTGLKSASFGGIESTNADGTETSTLSFPKTPTPLGVTIDFENKKITDYGKEFVFNGTESASHYSTLGDNSVRFGGLGGNDKNPVGVCTDGKVVSAITPNEWRIDFGNIYWYSVLDTLGFTENWANKTDPTTEEKNQAIADFKAYLAQRYADGNPVTIRYVSSVLQSETDFTADNEYTAYKCGTEKVLGNDGKEYGAENTLTQDYILVTEVK